MSDNDLLSLATDLRRVSVENDGQVLARETKQQKHLKNLSRHKRKPKFGVCFDVDGVLARGTLAIESAKEAMKQLCDEKGEVRVPIVFVTNSLNRACDKAQQITGWFNIPFRADQVIGAPAPLEVFKKLHDKYCLIIGQGKIAEISKDLGFKKFCTLDDIAAAYPLLDMVDHDNRKRIAAEGYEENPNFPRVEAVILLGEPKRWESSLQLLVDLLKTDGKPDKAPAAIPECHLPVIACNMDLQFMDRACMPRYGHGAFLLCLEALYKKVTGKELKYQSLVGKPSEITYRYAEHCLAREARKLNIKEPLETMYLIGDSPDTDIVGSNLYQRYIDRLHTRLSNDEREIDPSRTQDKMEKSSVLYDGELPESRNVPNGVTFTRQSCYKCHGILVCTGVYQEGVSPDEGADEKHYHGHRDFPFLSELYKPHLICKDVNKAIDYILKQEKITFQ
eukprot:GHVU01099448.1.p1 GENE.GHVU01099448.1~~GHVU01099448.1.p1  ORF type:complete len:449 (-),score=72.97 GHVU01099448.1:878-2224(-)